jgi:hypothetical protein
MSEAKKLYERIVLPAKDQFNEELVKMQNSCSHAKLSEWIDEYWAPAHSTGYEVQHCNRCDKEIHRRTSCMVCGSKIQDEKIKQFTVEMCKKARAEGRTISLPVNGTYCIDCFNGNPPAKARSRFKQITTPFPKLSAEDLKRVKRISSTLHTK